jgi:hypothetical protein
MAINLSALLNPASSVFTAPRLPVAGMGRMRKIALLGSHYSLEYAPWGDLSWELWGHASSRFLYKRKPDRYFDMHRKECWTAGRKEERYVHWLAKNTVPIYMQQVHPEVPASVRYPKEQIFAEFRKYFSSHAAYMIALALYEGVTHIGLFGINYSADSEYATQRGSTEYWLGFAEGRGVHIVIPARCTLLNDPPLLYAYESHDEQGRLVECYRRKRATVQVGKELRELKIVTRDSEKPAPAPPPPSVTQEMIDRDRAVTEKYRHILPYVE